MRHERFFGLALTLALAACNGGPVDEPTGALTLANKQTLKVAAIQYSEGMYKQVDASCATDVCAVQKLVAQAVSQGATFVVAPEQGLGQQYLELSPDPGEVPADSKDWAADTLIKTFSQQAKQLKTYLVINLQTYTEQPTTKKYNTLVAFGPGGVVLARHYKFELFSSEAKSLTPGKDFATSTFNTPLGKVGLLICADLYGDLRMQDKLTRVLGARVVLVSSFWTAPGAQRWQQSFAKNWGVYVVGSNLVSGAGRGGGIFDPEGQELALYDKNTPGVIVADIPQP